MKILVVNGNTSDEVTAILRSEAEASASKGTEITAVKARFGARVIGSRSENAIAQHAVLDAVARHAAGMDAILIAVSLDTALGAVREAASVPVVGMTEASLMTACMLGERLGVITFDRRLAAVYEALVASYGLKERLAGIHVVDMSPAAAAGARSETEAALKRAAESLIDKNRVEVVVAVGAVAAGMPRRLKDALPVPILDGISCGILQAELLVRLGARKPTVGSYALPNVRQAVDLGDPLGEFLGGGGAGTRALGNQSAAESTAGA